MNNICYKLIEGENIEMCRDLCNDLMKYQASVGKIRPDILAAMSFDSRMVPSYNNSTEKQLIVAYDGEDPIGYVFSNASIISEESKKQKPGWASEFGDNEQQGFYPDDLVLPAKIGSLNNLYVKASYRGQNIGGELCEKSLEWLRGVDGIDHVFVNISNGNISAEKFYEKHGFKFSHDSYGGFIRVYYLD